MKDVRRITGEFRARIVVPQSLQHRIVKEVHAMSHPGRKGTYLMLQQDHWFRGMKRIVKDVVSHCPDCNAVKGRRLVPEELSPDERPVSLGDR